MEHLIRFAAILGTIGLLGLTLYGMRRFKGAQSPGARMRVQQRVTVANGCQLVVVHWDGQELLIATGSQPCSLVASKPATGERAALEARGAWAQ